MNPAIIWLLAGALLIGFEVFIAPGIGVLFAGLGAVCVGVIIELNPSISMVAQIGWLFAFTVIWAAALWKPMKKFRKGSGAQHTYNNIIGQHALVINNPLRKGAEGEVKWSGSVMMAKLADNSPVDEVAADTLVEITDISGNTLTVKPR